MLLNVIWWLALLGLLGAGVWALVRWLGGGPGRTGTAPPAPASALDRLKQRYARGELDERTYLRMRAHLAASQPQEPVGAGQ